MSYVQHKRGMTFFSAPKWGHFLKPRKFSTGNEFIEKKGLRYLWLANTLILKKSRYFLFLECTQGQFVIRLKDRVTCDEKREGGKIRGELQPVIIQRRFLGLVV